MRLPDQLTISTNSSWLPRRHFWTISWVRICETRFEVPEVRIKVSFGNLTHQTTFTQEGGVPNVSIGDIFSAIDGFFIEFADKYRGEFDSQALRELKKLESCLMRWSNSPFDWFVRPVYLPLKDVVTMRRLMNKNKQEK